MPMVSERERINRVLVVEDDGVQRRMLRGILQHEGFDVVDCATAAEAIDHVGRAAFSCAVIDLRLPDLDGPRLLKRIRDHDDRIRVIIHTAHGSFDSARDAVNLGAFAFVEKAGNPQVLVDHIRRALHEQMGRYAEDLERAVAERTASLRRSEENLEETELLFRRLADSMDRVFWFMEIDPPRIIYATPAFETVWGVPNEELYRDAQTWIRCIHAEDRPAVEARFDDWASGRAPALDLEYRIVRPDGSVRWIQDSGAISTAPDGRRCASGIARDITERKAAEEQRDRLEEQLQQSQKLQAVGTLAAGVAHDFNNLLTAIVGFGDLARRCIPADSEAVRALDGIGEAVRQATSVTRSLLTFSRNAPAAKSPVHLGLLVGKAMRMLRHMLPASIRMTVDATEDEPLWIDGDGDRLQQVLLNLVLNARDAMPGGGELRVRVHRKSAAGSADVDDSGAHEFGVVALQVEDTGIGMNDEVRARVFEPFFSTKPREQGTGLGLAVVHGIVGEHGGRIFLDSVAGRGTRVHIVLPCCRPPAEPVDDPQLRSPPRSAPGATILLAEDNQQVRGILAAALTSSGHQVLQARDGEEALQILHTTARPVQVAVLDVDMPRRSGPACLPDLRRHHPNAAVVLITGTSDFLLPEGDEHVVVLHKPFRMIDLTSVVDRLLSQVRPPETSPHEPHQDTPR